MAEGKWRHASEHEATPHYYRAAEQAVTKKTPLRLNNAARWPSGIGERAGLASRAMPCNSVLLPVAKPMVQSLGFR